MWNYRLAKPKYSIQNGILKLEQEHFSVSGPQDKVLKFIANLSVFDFFGLEQFYGPSDDRYKLYLAIINKFVG